MSKDAVENEIEYAKENMKLYTDRRCVRADEGGRGFYIDCNNMETTFFSGIIFGKIISCYHNKVKTERID